MTPIDHEPETSIVSRDKGWIPTAFTGTCFYPLAPRTEDVDIRDIAHALACLNRFTGHVPAGPYSVAQHSLYVCQQLPRRLQLPGLLHDAAEAYLGDIARPWKKYIRIVREPDDRVDETLREAEDELLRVIFSALQVPWPRADEWATIKEADTAVLVAEGYDLFGKQATFDQWSHRSENGFQRAPIRVEPWGWERARNEFLSRYAALISQRG